MEFKQRELSAIASKLLFAMIIAIGMIIAAGIFSNSIANRPLMGSFSGSLSQVDYSNDEVMDIGELRGYLSMYPTGQYTIYYNEGIPISGYHSEEEKIDDELLRSITNGAWPGFPYVQLGERVYFSKQAVDDWFYEQGKAQLSVK